MSAPADRTPATDSPESFSQESRVPSLLEAEANARWRRSHCGPNCSCDECADRRARSFADEQPSLAGVDLSDPAFLELLKRAEQVRVQRETVRNRRTALRIALEWWNQ